MAIGLSMDAFSLALAIGTTNISSKKIIITSTIVGFFHFMMPILGNTIGLTYFKSLIVDGDILVGIVFLFLGIDMLLSLKDTKKVLITNILSIIIFAFSVSLDSFSVGIALSFTERNLIYPSIIFAITSFAFTYIGSLIGKYLNNKLGNKALIIGFIMLFSLALKYLIF